VVPLAYRIRVNEVLLTALVQAMGAWTGQTDLLVDVEGHGRVELFEEVDLTRTVGWFTTIYPVRLSLPLQVAPGEALKAIKEQLRGVPNQGLGYGILRYLAGISELADQLRTIPQAEISFNYLGQFDQTLATSTEFEWAKESSEPVRSAQGARRYLLELNGLVIGGQLRLEWTYSQSFHREHTIEHLAQRFTAALRALIAHCQSHEASGYTPSDFPEANLSQEELDTLTAAITKSTGSA
jgi:non-ribosomal peptide synthase protein (TIGR01720 family)